jgi:hypothetical protein
MQVVWCERKHENKGANTLDTGVLLPVIHRARARACAGHMQSMASTRVGRLGFRHARALRLYNVLVSRSCCASSLHVCARCIGLAPQSMLSNPSRSCRQ